jgi:hypothetical protein
MRAFMFTLLVALGLGLAGLATTSAAPINYTPLPSAVNGTNLVQKAWWNRYGQWCTRRCNWRRCRIVCR